jgi:hypothetical protein
MAASLAAAGCEKVPLLAPSGSTITLTASTTALPSNGTTDIVAQVLEASGTPPHSGTHITFTTTLGRIEPADPTTDVGGRVIVRFFAGGSNGTAIITASSGGASTGATGAVRIAVGTAAVGQVTLSANPSTISANGGLSTILARVVDLNGNVLVNVPVSFTTSAGALSAGLVNSDLNGNAQTVLSTSVEAVVTATVGVQSSTPGGGTGSGGGTGNGGGTTGGSTTGQASAQTTVRVNPLPTISITAPGGILTANSPIVFTLSVTQPTNSVAPIRDVVVDFGDGTTRNLGSVTGANLTVAHQYEDDGTFTVSVRVTDTIGGVATGATVVVIQPEPPLGVTISFTKLGNPPPTTATFTATVTPSTTTVSTYQWNFGDGQSQTTTSNQVVHTYSVAGVYTVTVTVTTNTGQSASGQTAIGVP